MVLLVEQLQANLNCEKSSIYEVSADMAQLGLPYSTDSRISVVYYWYSRVETWLLDVRVSVSVCRNPGIRFQFWFGFTAVEK